MFMKKEQINPKYIIMTNLYKFLWFSLLFTVTNSFSNFYKKPKFYLKTPDKLENNQEKSKKIITISPSGLHGYYLLGIASYLKENYDLNEYIFSGSSAGSWISLIMLYKGNHQEIIQDVLNTSEENKQSIKSLGSGLKKMFLAKYKNTDFDFERCYMGLIDVKIKTHPIEANTLIYSNFTTLEDAINCCIASSHVPFVMGNMFRKYRDRYTLDGGFGNNPYHGNGHKDGNCIECQITDTQLADLHIHPFIWFKRPVLIFEFLCNQFKLFIDLFSISYMNFRSLYQDGYNDARDHKEDFDKIFLDVSCNDDCEI